jgi:hypothetical protein
MLSSKAANQRACLGSSSGSKLPSGSRGVAIRIWPLPVSTVLAVKPLGWSLDASGFSVTGA